MPQLQFLPSPQPVLLDYAGAEELRDLLRNISGVSADGQALWTASDEARTIQRLQMAGDDYRCVETRKLVDLFPDLPGGDDEVDLEGLDVVNGRLWLCGSHSRVRRKASDDGALNPEIRPRPSRNLLGAVPAGQTGGGGREDCYALPFTNEGSLRRRLRNNALLEPFMDLPSKENGLDIEGLAVLGDRLLLGLRGPVIGGFGMIVELHLRRDGSVGDRKPVLHTLGLGGLGIRDLARWNEDVIVLAGPVTSADGPFQLYLWRPSQDPRPQSGLDLDRWPIGREHPEGICRLRRGGRDGLLVVYDSPDGSRISGSRYRADWFEITS